MIGEVSTGAADDLAKATDIARECITQFGMSEVGQAVLERRRLRLLDEGRPGMGDRDYSEPTANQVDVAIREMIDGSSEEAKALLLSRMKDLSAGATLLLERETITPDDFPPIRRSADLPTTTTLEKTGGISGQSSRSGAEA